MSRWAKTRTDWTILAVSFLPGPAMGFAFAFNPGTCNQNFSDLNFVLLLLFGSATALGSLYCMKRAILG